MSAAARNTSPRTDRWSTGAAARISATPHRTVDYWAKIGLVVPIIDAVGTGSDRWYSFDDLVVLSAVRATGACSIALKKRVVETIRQDSGKPYLRLAISSAASLFINLDVIRSMIREATHAHTAP